MRTSEHEPLIRTGEVARRLGSSAEWVRQLATKGQIPSIRVEGGYRRYRWSDIEVALGLGDGGAE